VSKVSNQEYLLTRQYKDESNLNARIQLHARFSTNKYGWHRWRETFLEFVEQRLALHGPIHITKASGLFEAF
jgi:hypothetical protein